MTLDTTSLKATEVNEEVNYSVKFSKIHEIAVLLKVHQTIAANQSGIIRIIHQPNHQRISMGIWGSYAAQKNLPGHLQGHRTCPYRDKKCKRKVNGTGLGKLQDTQL
jgi:hypothetical protein